MWAAGDSRTSTEGETLRTIAIVTAAAAALATAGCGLLGQNAAANQADARSDVATLGRDVAIWYVDSGDAPDVSYADGVYSVTGNEYEASVEVTDFAFNESGAVDWCVTFAFEGGQTDAVSYGAQTGLTDTWNCE